MRVRGAQREMSSTERERAREELLEVGKKGSGKEGKKEKKVFLGEVSPIRCAFPVLPFICFPHPFARAAGVCPALTPTDGNAGGFSPAGLSPGPAALLV